MTVRMLSVCLSFHVASINIIDTSSNSLPSPLIGTSVLDGLDVLAISVQYCHLPVQERYNYHALFCV